MNSLIRPFYLIGEFLSAFFALSSPIVIIHWLLRAINSESINPIIVPLNAILDPLNATLEMIYPFPTIHYEGNAIPLTQAALGVLFTLLFFATNGVVSFLKYMEDKMQTTQQAFKQQVHQQRIKVRLQKEKEKIIEDKGVLVYIEYDFGDNPQGANYLKPYNRFEGELVSSVGSVMMVKFDHVEKGFDYCIQAGQTLLSYYATLRPMDPQPPFKMAMTINKGSGQALSQTQDICRQIIRFAGPNQVVFSANVKPLVETLGLQTGYRYQSMGEYDIAGEKSQEVFQLRLVKSV